MRNVWIMIMGMAFLVCPDARSARAQQDNDTATAEQLFVMGRALLKKGEVDAACVKFEVSQKLDPALGTLLNLALCREKQGKVATAWALYRQAEAEAWRQGQTRHEAVARARARALQAHIPRLTIKLAASGQITGLVVERDGTAVDAAHFGEAVYVDPGTHRVVARAPGHKEFSADIEIARGEEASVVIPVLARRRGAQEDKSVVTERVIKEPVTQRNPGRARRLMGLGAGGAGIAALAAGVGFGWSARTTWNKAFANEWCDRDTLTCSPAGQAQTNLARSRALTSNILTGAGVALVAAGVVLYLTAPARTHGADTNTGVALMPMAGPHQLSVTLQGGF